MKKLCSFNGKKIHYNISGRGQTLVLIHGYLESLEMWIKHQEFLSTKYRVISIDLPGHGKTDHYFDVHTMHFMADIVYEVLKNEKVEKCVMIGHSMGGYTTLAFADKYPQMLDGFGLFHSQATADNEAAKLNRERTIDLIEQDKGHFIYHFIPTLFAPSNEKRLEAEIQHQIKIADAMQKASVIAAMAGMKDRESYLDILMEINVPVLFILGKHDTRIPLEKVLAQASLPKTSQILILGNSGHMGWLEEKEKTIAALDGFMQLCYSTIKH